MGAILRLILAGVISWVAAISPLSAGETIHTWTDSEGVRHFSTSAPPEDAQNHEIFIQGDNGPADNAQVDMRRPSYNNMVDEVRVEANRLEQERLQSEKEKKKREKKAAQKRRQDAIEAKRLELQKKIDALMGRALSPTFSKGMRDSQIKAIREQIKQLKNEANQPNSAP